MQLSPHKRGFFLSLLPFAFDGIRFGGVRRQHVLYRLAHEFGANPDHSPHRRIVGILAAVHRGRSSVCSPIVAQRGAVRIDQRALLRPAGKVHGIHRRRLLLHELGVRSCRASKHRHKQSKIPNHFHHV